MKGLPDIGARVRLSALALERLERATGRARDEAWMGTVAGRSGKQALVKWAARDVPMEWLNPVYLELVT